MKLIIKIIVILIAIIVGLGMIYIGYNQLDAPAAHFFLGEKTDTSSLRKLSESLWPQFSQNTYDRSNGFYKLWTLSEPEDTNIDSEEAILKIRRMHDPRFDNEKYLKEWAQNNTYWKKNKHYHGKYRDLSKKRLKILEKYGTFDSYSGSSARDWCQMIIDQKAAVLKLKSLYQVYLERYQQLIDTEFVEDFTLIRLDSAIPNLLAWLHVARIYNTAHMLNALEGKWDKGVSILLDHINLTKKIIKTSRTIILSIVAKAIMREALYGLAGLMNQPEFPQILYKKIIDGLPPLKVEEYATTSLAIEGYLLSQINKEHLLMQPNRTRQYFYNFISKMVNSEKIPPFQWKSYPMENYEIKKSWLWWVQNPVGKIYFDKWHKSREAENLFVVLHKSIWLKCLYDMTRIAAELHLNYSPERPIQSILNSIKTYLTWIDPCSGKPYKWNEQKNLLYSIGIDRKDNNGKQDRLSLDTDYILPVILFIRIS